MSGSGVLCYLGLYNIFGKFVGGFQYSGGVTEIYKRIKDFHESSFFKCLALAFVLHICHIFANC